MSYFPDGRSPVHQVERALWRAELYEVERDAEGWRKYAGHLERLVVQLRERAEFAEAEVIRKKTQLQSVEEELGFSEARAASMKAMLQAVETDGSGNDAEEEEENGHANDAEAPVVVEPRLQTLDRARRSPQENSGSEDSAYEPFAAYEPYGGRPSRSSSRAAETTDHEDYDEDDDADADDEADPDAERLAMDGSADGVVSFANPSPHQGPAPSKRPSCQVPLARMPVVSTTRGVQMPAPPLDEPPSEAPPRSPSGSEDEHGFVHEGVDAAEMAANASYEVGEGAANTVLNGLGWVRERLRRDSF